MTPHVQDPLETESSAEDRPDLPAEAPEEDTDDADVKIDSSTSPVKTNKTKPENNPDSRLHYSEVSGTRCRVRCEAPSVGRGVRYQV